MNQADRISSTVRFLPLPNNHFSGYAPDSEVLLKPLERRVSEDALSLVAGEPEVV